MKASYGINACMKRESVKDYKCFFYQYSESSYLQLKTLTNVQITM